MIARLRCESGQALMVSTVFMTALLGSVALTLDVGSWYREHRQAQTTADAAALAGAQSLPGNTAGSTASVQSYATKNGGGIDPAAGISFRSDFEPNDTVLVKVTRTAPGFFSKLFSIDSTNVHATAAARSAVPADVFGAAPIVVNKQHQYISGTVNGKQCPCFDQQTSIPLGKNGAPGSFAMVDLSAFATGNSNGQCANSPGGNTGTSTIGSWVLNGYQGWLGLGCYDSRPGADFNSQNVSSAMNIRKNSTLLFPVYDTLVGQGSNAQYHVIAWAAFYVTGFDGNGSSGNVYGYFKQVIWDGIQSSSGPPTSPDLGVRSIALVN